MITLSANPATAAFCIWKETTTATEISRTYLKNASNAQQSAGGGLPTSLKCSSARMCGGLRFLDRPALVEFRNFHKNRCEIPLASGALEPDLRF
jgi:hypothetical protein